MIPKMEYGSVTSVFPPDLAGRVPYAMVKFKVIQ